MQPSPLQLLQCSFEAVNVTSVPEFDNKQRNPNFVINPVGMSLTSETSMQELVSEAGFSDYAIRLVIAFEPKAPNSIPYRGELILQAEVRMHGAKTPPDREKLALVNGVSLIYGVARDMVCTVTSRGVHGQMLLPTLNFRSLADSVDTGEAHEASSTQGDGLNVKRKKPIAKQAGRAGKHQ